ncbi:MAG: bifunctional oligoribonuclease/PAP phosphatase NrnA [Chloroflexi bacterium]|nr:bifunctional oligoribonuclease/PAP phosphatase NrnA [Chloroflexota bacterium]
MNSEIKPKPLAEAVLHALGRSQNPFLICHIDPDGDALGSLLGLGLALRKMGKNPTLVSPDGVPAIYDFLPGQEFLAKVPAVSRVTHEDLIVVLDSSDLKRISSYYDATLFASRPVANIDHHATNTLFGNINYVDTSAGACAEIVCNLLDGMHEEINPEIATCLLTGIFTDTLGFRTTSTTPQMLQLAARLVQHGAPLAGIAEKIDQRRSLVAIRLWTKILETLQLDGKIAWAQCDLAMRRSIGASEDESSGVLRTLTSVAEASVFALFTERSPGRIDVSLRSRPGYNVSKVAFRLGGGGHPQAAGCSLEGEMATIVPRVLSELRIVANNTPSPQGNMA